MNRQLRLDIRGILGELGTEGDLRSVGDEDSLLEAAVLDSAAMVDLIERLEARYAIAIDEDELVPENFDSVAAIASFIEGKKS